VVSQIDRTHPALAQAAQDAVSPQAARLVQRVGRGPGPRRRRVYVGSIHAARVWRSLVQAVRECGKYSKVYS
jgi:hypothetical protein